MALPSPTAAHSTSLGRLVAETLRLALPLYLVSLGVSVLGTVFGLVLLMLAAGGRPWLADLAGANRLNVLLELGVAAIAAPAPDRAAIGLLGLGSAVLATLTLVLQWLAYTFLAGGILERLRLAPVNGVVSRRFWHDCRRWFWPFVRLGAAGLVLLVLTGTVVVVLGILASRVVSMTVATVAVAALLALAVGWLEVARAAMVLRGYRSAHLALRNAGWITVQPRAVVLWLLLALPWLGLIVATGRPPAAEGVLSTLAALAIGQVCAYLGAWLKVIRLAAAVRLVAAHERP